MSLVAFDFEGTPTASDLSVLLGREHDVGVATTLRQHVSLLDGMPEPRAEDASERCELRNGTAELIADIR